MILCYGKQIVSLELIQNKWGVRALIQYANTGKQHDVSLESISWVSKDWYDK
jgi:hypothetical protein